MDKYKYFAFDAQYILTRNFHKIKYLPHFSLATLSRSCYETIAKLIRESVQADKVILLWDKSPYHKLSGLADYKGNRTYLTKEDLNNEALSPEQKKDIENHLRVEEIKMKCKYFIINEFGKIGMPSFIKSGYEADDLAGILANSILSENDGRKSAVSSKDSDWKYFANTSVDFVDLKTQKVHTYEDTRKEFSENINLTLYEFKSFLDSLLGSHNNLVKTISDDNKITLNELLPKILTGDLSDIIDLDKYNRQMTSFDVTSYPEYEKVKSMMYYKNTNGSIMSESDYSSWRLLKAIIISPSYYKTFVSNLDENLYKETYTDVNE